MAIEARRVIILGVSGFVGKYLFGKFSETKETKTIGFSSKELNLLSAQELRRKLSDVTSGDILIVAAAITRLKENTFSSMLKNIQMAENIANFIAEHSVGQVVYLSTIDVYGIDIKKSGKITEQSKLSPNDYYAISKLSGEFLLKRVCTRRRIPLVILRLSGVYGPGDTGKSTISAIVSAALREKKINIYGDGKNLRDYVYIDDLYKLIKYAISNRLNITVNVATGKSYSISKIASIIKASLPIKIGIEFKENPVEESDKRVEDLVFDSAYLKNNFPGLGLLDLKDGIPVYLKRVYKEKVIV